MEIITNLLKKGIITIFVLVVGIGMCLLCGFNKSFDFTGGTVISIDITTISEDSAKLKANNVLEEYEIKATSMSVGENSSGHDILVIKYQQSQDAVNEQVLEDLYAAFEYDKTIPLEESYIKLTQNLSSAYSSSVVLNALIATLTLLVAVGVYLGLRYGLGSAITAIVAGILDVATMLSLVLIFRVFVGVELGYSILAIVGLSLIFNTITLSNLRKNALDENMKKLTNQEIADLTIKQNLKTMLLLAGIVCAIFVAFSLLTINSGASTASLSLALGMLGVLVSSIFITPTIWSFGNIARSKKPKVKKVAQQETETIEEM